VENGEQPEKGEAIFSNTKGKTQIKRLGQSRSTRTKGVLTFISSGIMAFESRKLILLFAFEEKK